MYSDIPVRNNLFRCESYTAVVATLAMVPSSSKNYKKKERNPTYLDRHCIPDTIPLAISPYIVCFGSRIKNYNVETAYDDECEVASTV